MSAAFRQIYKYETPSPGTEYDKAVALWIPGQYGARNEKRC